MNESVYLDHVELPRELARARRKRWSRCVRIVVASALAFGGLEVLYTSPLLPMLGLREMVRPFWHYITAGPVVIAAYSVLVMLVTLPKYRKKRAHHQHVFDMAHPGMLKLSMLRRYQRSRRDMGELEDVARGRKRAFLRKLLLGFMWLALALICRAVPRDLALEIYSIPVWLLSLGASYFLGLMGVSLVLQSLNLLPKWLESRAKVQDQLEFEADLVHVRRELHGEDVMGALTATSERLDGGGDLSLSDMEIYR